LFGFSEAFLILRSQNAGLPVALVPTVMVVMNVVYALAAYPAGALSDRRGQGGLLAVGIVCLIVADLILALGMTIPLVMLGVAFLGLHMALTQGLFASLVADTAPADLRGTAFGVFTSSGAWPCWSRASSPAACGMPTDRPQPFWRAQDSPQLR
jgi:MFS family permease